MTDDRQRLEWKEDKRFEKDGLCVIVQKLALRRPKYSLYLGKIMEKGISRYFPIFSEGKGQIAVKRVGVPLYDLIAEAEDYIQSELQILEDNWVEDRQFHENRSANRGKRGPQIGLSGGPNSGKTARKKENKRKRLAGES